MAVKLVDLALVALGVLMISVRRLLILDLWMIPAFDRHHRPDLRLLHLLRATFPKASAMPLALELLAMALEPLRRRRLLPPAAALAKRLALEVPLNLELAVRSVQKMTLASVLLLLPGLLRLLALLLPILPI